MSHDVTNPYESPKDADEVNGRDQLVLAPEHTWQGRVFTIRVRLLPWCLWLVNEHLVTLDNTHTFTSSQLRLKERFDFTFEHLDRTVTARYETFGFVFGGEHYRLFLEGQLVAESQVRVPRWWLSVFVCVSLGIVIAVGFMLSL